MPHEQHHTMHTLQELQHADEMCRASSGAVKSVNHDILQLSNKLLNKEWMDRNSKHTAISKAVIGVPTKPDM